MVVLRRTFVVHVQVVDGVAVVENPRTHEHVRVDDLREIGTQIGNWLANEPADDILHGTRPAIRTQARGG